MSVPVREGIVEMQRSLHGACSTFKQGRPEKESRYPAQSNHRERERGEEEEEEEEEKKEGERDNNNNNFNHKQH